MFVISEPDNEKYPKNTLSLDIHVQNFNTEVSLLYLLLQFSRIVKIEILKRHSV